MKETAICVGAKGAARHAADDRGDRKRLKRTPDTLRSKRGRTHRISVASLTKKDAHSSDKSEESGTFFLLGVELLIVEQAGRAV